MSGDGEVIAEVVEGALVIPETALRYQGDRIYVNRVVRESDPRIEEAP